MNLYPIWNSQSHGPACTAGQLADEEQPPSDVIAFSDHQNLVERLRLLGWGEVAEWLESNQRNH
jgi:hypothetical protein